MIETKEQFSDQSSFWEQQRALVRQMEDKEARTVAKNALEKYRSRRIALLGETIYISAMIFFSKSKSESRASFSTTLIPACSTVGLFFQPFRRAIV